MTELKISSWKGIWNMSEKDIDVMIVEADKKPYMASIPNDMEAFTEMLWNSLNEENKVSLFVRYIDIATGKYETKIINKNA